jgi:beta-galactosidase
MSALRYSFFNGLFLFIFLFGYGQSSFRKHINIDDSWKFHFGNASDASKDFNYGIRVIFKKTGEAA